MSLLGCKIYYGTAGGNYVQELDLVSTRNTITTAITIANHSLRTVHYFTVKTCDTLCNYSDFSGEVHITTNLD